MFIYINLKIIICKFNIDFIDLKIDIRCKWSEWDSEKYSVIVKCDLVELNVDIQVFDIGVAVFDALVYTRESSYLYALTRFALAQHICLFGYAHFCWMKRKIEKYKMMDRLIMIFWYVNLFIHFVSTFYILCTLIFAFLHFCVFAFLQF